MWRILDIGGLPDWEAFRSPGRGHPVHALLKAGALKNEEGLFSMKLDEVKSHTTVLDGRYLNPLWRLPRSFSWEATFDDIDRARSAPPGRLLHSLLNPSSLVHPDAWQLLSSFGTIRDIFDADLAALTHVLMVGSVRDGRGERRARERAREIHTWLSEPWRRALLDRWSQDGVRNLTTIHPLPTQSLLGRTVELLPGKGNHNMALAEEIVLVHGGHLHLAGRPDHVVQLPGESLPRRPREQEQQPEPWERFVADVLQAPDPFPTGAADQMWASVLAAHGTRLPIGGRGPLPYTHPAAVRPGGLYMYTREAEQIVLVLANSLESAVKALETDESDLRLSRADLFWTTGTVAEIRAASPILKHKASGNALSRGRPRIVQTDGDWANAPPAAGIYRIHFQDAHGVPGRSIYIGRSQNFRARPRRHDRTKGIPWSDGTEPGVSQIELIPVKASQHLQAWHATDLDDAEERHIRRAQERYDDGTGPRVLNTTGGRNGPPSRPPSQTFVWVPGRD